MIPVAVQDEDGNFVIGLAETSFNVFFDNFPQRIVRLDPPDGATANIVLLFDVSPSSEPYLKEISSLAAQFIDDLRPNERMMVSVFNTETRIREPFTNDKAKLAKSLKGIKFRSGTSIYDTVSELVTEKLVAETGRTYVLIFTDGVDTTSIRADFESSLIEAERGGVTFIPIYLETYLAVAMRSRARPPVNFPSLPGWGNNITGTTAAEYQVGRDYLNDLSTATGGRPYVFSIEPVEQDKMRRNILAGIRSTYLLRVKPPAAAADVKRYAVRVRVAKPSVHVYAPGSYLTGY